MRTFMNCIAIIASTLAGIQVMDRQYWPALILGAVGVGAFLLRRRYPLPGREDERGPGW